MELYTTPGGQWAGSEKDWKAKMKAEGVDVKTYAGRKTVDVPTKKADLLEFLTFHNVNVINPGSHALGVEASGGAGTPQNPAPSPEVPDLEALRALHNPEGVAAEGGPQPDPVAEATAVSYADRSFQLDELFHAAPLGQQLTLTQHAIERAYKTCVPAVPA